MASKPMTAKQACAVFNEMAYRKREWFTSGSDVYTREHQCEDHEHLQFTAFEAAWIAQGLTARAHETRPHRT